MVDFFHNDSSESVAQYAHHSMFGRVRVRNYRYRREEEPRLLAYQHTLDICKAHLPYGRGTFGDAH